MRYFTNRRAGLGVILASIALHAASCGSAQPVAAEPSCGIFHVTGYVHTGYRTADGTSTYGHEWALAAAHPRIPFGSIVTIDGVAVVRVADRGWLGPNDLDILVGTEAEALNLTGEYTACVA